MPKEKRPPMNRAHQDFYRFLRKLNTEAKEHKGSYLTVEEKFLPLVELMTNKDISYVMLQYATLKRDGELPETPFETDLDYVLFYCYAAVTSYLPHDKTSEVWAVYKHILSSFTTDSPFVQVAQNKATNAIAFLSDRAITIDLAGDATAKIDDVDLVLKDYDKLSAKWSTKVVMLETYLLEDFAKTRRQTTSLPLKDYAEKRGIKSSDLKDFKKETVQALDILASIKDLSYKERINGKWEYCGSVSLNGGTHVIERGNIRWNWNTDFLPSLERLAPLDLPKEAYTSDPRTNQWQVINYIAQNYRRNEGRESLSTIPVKTLLDKMPALPKIETVREERHSARLRILKPFFRDLDFFDSFTYDVIDQNGNIVDEPDLNLSYEQFEACSIRVNYTDWPVHEQRIEHRVKREQAAIEGKKKRKRKAAEEAAQADKEKTE